MVKNIYQLEFKLFFRNPTVWIGIVLLLITGFVGLYIGKAFITKQQAVIEKAAVLQQKNTQSNIKHFGNDIGLVFYHNKFSLANMPDPWAAFANGQRDINPYLISTTMLALEGQLYDTDINNPVSLLFGNMDISFVFIFLFPLVIIALTYNLISEQRENGVWSLLKSQTNELFKVIVRKFGLRIFTIYVVAFFLMVVAVIYLKLPIDQTLLAVCVLIFLYLLFWFAAAFFVISLGKPSNYNASALVGFWVLMSIVVPGGVNLFLAKQYPVPEALQNVINQREGYHEKWDMPKTQTMKAFFEHYPTLKKYPFAEEKSFSWFWYYGMQQMGDDQAKESRAKMAQKLAIRQRFTNIAALFFPTIQTQLAINELAKSDLGTHLQFQQAVRDEHEKVRLHFYPSIFLERKIEETDLTSFGLKPFTAPKVFSWYRFVPLLIFALFLLLIGKFNFRKSPSKN